MESSSNPGKTPKVLNSGMIQRTLKSLIFVLALMSWHSSSANFIVGGELTYRCLPMMGTGLMKYEVTLVVYGDCNNGKMSMFDRQARIDFYHTDTFGVIDFIHPLLPFPLSIDTLSSGINPSCDPEASEVCVVRAIYRDTVTLDQKHGTYTFAYQRCCRNATIDNIEDPMNTGMTITAVVTEEARNSCNAGPAWNQYPEIFVCIGQNISVDAGATEPDGDELRYRLCTPYEFGSMTQMWPNAPVLPPYQEITWVSPFSETNMIGGSDPLTIDPATGRISGTPDIAGQFLIGVCVDEFRNGEFISSTRRDFQLNTIACGDIPVADFNAPELQCGDLTVTFENNSINAETFEWYFNWPSTDDSDTVENPTYTFPDTGSYVVALIVDNGTGCTDTLFKTITLRDTGIEADFTIEQFVCGDSITTILTDISTDNVSTLVSNVWTIIYGNDTLTFTDVMVPTLNIPEGVLVEVTLTVTAANECSRSITKEFTSESEIGLIPDFETVIEKCNDTYTIRVTDTSTDTQGTILTWEYILTYGNNEQDTSNDTNPTFIVEGFQDVTLVLNITSTTGCEGSVTRTFPLTPDIDLSPIFDFDVKECDSILVIDFTDESFNGTGNDPQITGRVWKVVVVGTTDTLTFATPNITLTYEESVTIQVSLTNTYDNGCVSTTTEEYEFNLLGDLNWQEEYEVCPGKRVQLNVNPNIPGLQYSWSPTETIFAPDDESPWAGPEVTTTYTATITDSLTGCSITREATVTVTNAERADFTFESECGITEVTFTKISGGPVVKWVFGDGDSLITVDPIVTHNYADTSQTYTVTLFTGGECPDTISKEVTILFINMDFVIDSIPACDGDTVFLNPDYDPALGYDFVWEPADKIIGDNTIPNPQAFVTETTTFTVTITDPTNDSCGLVKEVVVFVPDPITLNTDSFIELCQDSVVTLVASSPTAASYTWFDQNGDTLGTGDTLIIEVDTDIVITVRVVDIFGCEIEKSVEIEFFKVVFNSENPLCIGDTTTIFITVPDVGNVVSYLWGPADQIISGGTSDSIVVSPAQTTVYTVEVTYLDGCVLTGTYTQVVSGFMPNMSISMDPDTIISGSTSTLTVTPCPSEYTFSWEPSNLVEDPNSCETETLELEENTTFTVTVTNEDGCELVLSTTVTVTDPRCEEPFIFLPNLFTPNGDGVNDILYLRAFEPFIISVELVIYNRLGKEVFTSNSLSDGWDGTFQGETLAPDTFGFYLRVVCIDGQTFTKKGNVTLMR